MALREAKYFDASSVDKELLYKILQFAHDPITAINCIKQLDDKNTLVLVIKSKGEFCSISIFTQKISKLFCELINPELSEDRRKEFMLCRRDEYATIQSAISE